MDFFDGITTLDFGIGSVVGIIKLLFVVLTIGYLLYVLLFTLRVRILADTVKTPSNNTAKIVSYVHLLLAVIGSAVAVILILVG